MSNENPKVLIVCEHASQTFGGEAMLPFNYFLLLSSRLSLVCLLTHERTRRELERIEGIKKESIYYVPDTRLHKLLHRIGSWLPSRIELITTGAISHGITQLFQWWIARKVVRQRGIEIVHEAAPVSPKQPSMMWGLGVPVVIGPMNGGMVFPEAFSSMASRWERSMYRAMRAASNLLNLLVPGKLLADVLLVANERTRKALPAIRLGKVTELVENGVFAARVRRQRRPHENGKPIRVLYVGRLVDWKTVDILIDAVARCPSNVVLDIVGDGPERQRLERLADTRAGGKIRFVGAVPHAQVANFYDQADLFALASVRECGGAVVLEAMARGLPVIATRWGGPVDYVDETSGVLIEPKSRDYMVAAFAENILRLAEDAALRNRMGENARLRVVAKFLWENKIDRIVEIYGEVMRRSSSVAAAESA